MRTEQNSSAEAPPNRWRFALLVLGCWTISALISTSVALTLGPMRQENQPVGQILLMQLAIWWFWAAITPAVWSMGRRFSIEAQHTRKLPVDGNGLVPQTSARGKLARTISIHAIGAIGTATLFALYNVLLVHLFFWETASKEPFLTLFRTFLSSRFPLGVLLYFAVLGVGIALDSRKRLRQREIHASELSAALARAQVQALQTQLHPHFLFNTLHAIGMLVHEDPTSAGRMLTRLGDLLRQTLALTDVPEISLREEISILDDYIGIERVRFGDRLRIDLDIDESVLDAAVPTFVMQPLVENAVRFGVTSRVGPGRIRIAARRQGPSLQLTVDDEGPDGSVPDPVRAIGSTEPLGVNVAIENRNGVGLATTRARLATLYPGSATSLVLTRLQNGGTTVVVTLPFRIR